MENNDYRTDSTQVDLNEKKEWVNPEIREISKSKIQGSSDVGDDGGGLSTAS